MRPSIPHYWIAVGLFLSGCTEFEPRPPADDELLDGPVESLNRAENQRFISGDVSFNDEIFTLEKGLGPLFIATSCGSCHPGDGKGHPFTTLTRFGQIDATGNQFLQQGGPQLQHRAIPGYQPETVPGGATFTRLTPPANTGLGFLDAVSDADILSYADPFDADGDGISGVPNRVDLKNYLIARPGSDVDHGKYIGRFGKKASTYDLLQQTATAYNQDMGINSIFEPVDTYSGNVKDPEVSEVTVQDVVFYLKTLKAPVQRNANDTEIIQGKQIFTDINCSQCHRPEWTTGDSPTPALAYKTFYPYTDLLLHDMGPGLDDIYTEGTATTAEWRTPPLWGIGLSKNSQGGEYFLLHDGRARTIEEAIILHGGEAVASKASFEALPDTDKRKLVRFLESL